MLCKLPKIRGEIQNLNQHSLRNFLVMAIATVGLASCVSSPQPKKLLHNVDRSPPYNEEAQKRLQERDRPAQELYARALIEYNSTSNFEHCYQELLLCEALADELKLMAYGSASMRLRSKILILQGKYEQALAVYLKQAHGDHRVMSTEEALCYVKMGNFEKARPAFPNDYIKTAVCLKAKDLPNPETATGLEACLWLTLAMEESLQAPLRKLDFYKKAEALAPSSAGILYYEGRTMTQLGYSYEAIQAKYERAYRNGDGIRNLLKNQVDNP